MKRLAAFAAMVLAAAPVWAQGVPFQYLLETSMNDTADKAGWKWEDVAKQGFKAAGAGDGLGLAFDAEAGRTYFLVAACASPCTKVALQLMTGEQQRIGDIVWGARAGEVEVATLSYTAEASGRLIMAAAIGECPAGQACPGGASVYAVRR